MKKLLIVIVVFFILLSSTSVENSFSLNDYFSGDYTAYSHQKISKESVFLGSCYMTANKVDLKKVVGESVVLKNYEASQILKTLKAKIVSSEFLDTGASVIYAYSYLVPRSVKVQNKKVNLQVAIYDDHIVLGWPVILGSF